MKISRFDTLSTNGVSYGGYLASKTGARSQESGGRALPVLPVMLGSILAGITQEVEDALNFYHYGKNGAVDEESG